MSIIYGDNFDGQTSLSNKTAVFCNLFLGCNKLVNAVNLILPATTLSTSCYNSMFRGCTNLVKAPELPSMTATDSC